MGERKFVLGVEACWVWGGEGVLDMDAKRCELKR